MDSRYRGSGVAAFLAYLRSKKVKESRNQGVNGRQAVQGPVRTLAFMQRGEQQNSFERD